MSEFDATWEAAKRGEDPPPPDGFFDDGPDVPPPWLAPASASVGTIVQGTALEMKPALRSALKAIEERAKLKGALGGAECGLKRLDYALDGWQRGRLHVIGGRTGMGKSVVGLNIAMGLAERGNGVDFLSLEMPTEEQALRALLCRSRVKHDRIKNNKVLKPHWSRLTVAINDMCTWPWVWDDKGGVTVEWIAQHTEQTREKLQARGADLHSVVIDHIQKIRGSEPRAPRHEQMKWIVDGLKQLAKRQGLCVSALAQISRATEERTIKDHRPRMANLREAGAVEEEADAVALLYREDYYADANAPRTNVLEINLPKLRGGQPTLVRLRFDGQRYRVDNLEEDEHWVPEHSGSNMVDD
jgi:replicative DNA helicase